jgi:hypothetical protein
MQKKLALLLTIILTTAAISVTVTAKDVDIPSSWRDCRQDMDCSLIVRCGSCCPDHAINKDKINDYRYLYKQECENPRPPCPCAYREPECKQGVCEIRR